MRQIMAGKLTVWIDPAGKQERVLNIEFMLAAADMPALSN